MITVEEAKQKVVENTPLKEPEKVHVQEGLRRTLSEDVFSPVNYPPFDQSAMDGYAFNYSVLNTEDSCWLPVHSESTAGNMPDFLPLKQAMRIFTGAPVPEGADTIIIQENTKLQNGHIWIKKELTRQGDNIRKEGSNLTKEDLVLKKGHTLTPACTGLLASLGIASVKVFRQPAISIIISGNELSPAGKDLQKGQIYESNSFLLSACLDELNIEPVKVTQIRDDAAETLATISKALKQSDIVLTTGGISVGDYDLVKNAFEECQVEDIFYKVAQKPGKPLFFGKKEATLVFGLPGNPASVLSCFYQYVYPAINKIQGKKSWFLKERTLPISHPVNSKAGKTRFLKALVDDEHETVKVLEGQGSHILHSFAHANALVYLPAETDQLQEGDKVKVQMLPELP